MGIQIFGTKKCKETAKAIRFFKERRIEIHFVDLAQKAMSAGELKNISRSIPPEELIDTDSREYAKLNLSYIRHDASEMLLAHPLLFKTPVVRNGNTATAGFKPDAWTEWIK